MSFESEKKGLQSLAETLSLAMSRGAFGFDDIETLSNAKQVIRRQYILMEEGLAGILAGQSVSENTEPFTVPTPKLAIPQPDIEQELRASQIEQLTKPTTKKRGSN